MFSDYCYFCHHPLFIKVDSNILMSDTNLPCAVHWFSQRSLTFSTMSFESFFFKIWIILFRHACIAISALIVSIASLGKQSKWRDTSLKPFYVSPMTAFKHIFFFRMLIPNPSRCSGQIPYFLIIFSAKNSSLLKCQIHALFKIRLSLFFPQDLVTLIILEMCDIKDMRAPSSQSFTQSSPLG